MLHFNSNLIKNSQGYTNDSEMFNLLEIKYNQFKRTSYKTRTFGEIYSFPAKKKEHPPHKKMRYINMKLNIGIIKISFLFS